MRGAQVMFLLAILIPGTGHAIEPAQLDRMWDFQSDTVGPAVAGYRVAVGEWTIAADGQNKVLAQTAGNAELRYST
ncbi:MAG: hypothetical protein U0992_00085 [Planctomycetaceae bacterium]